MDISIIIPTLNEEQNIGRLIDRLLTESTDQFEIIVVDGGSKDNTTDIADAKGAKIIKTGACRAAQMNAGAEIAQFSNLYFVHADTLPPIGFIEDLSSIKTRGYKAGCYRSKFVGGPFILKMNAFFTRFNWLFVRGGDQSLFIDRSYFFELGKYDEEMCIMEEYPLIDRIMKANYWKVLPKVIEIDTRKYDNRSWLIVNKADLSAFRMFKKGEPSEKIKKHYKEMLSI
ncbi:MAG: TIGR04283 family arsenosugar biosynthesis glycosyltransferase [Crocinitomicaceae bacterium]